MDSLPAVGLLRVDHVGIAVADLDEAIAFYARTFGLRCVHQETNEEQGVREAMLAAGDDGAGARIQLLAPLRPDSAIAFYEHAFGMRCVHQETNQSQGVREAMLDVGPASPSRIQLLAPLTPESPIARFLDRSGPGVQQVAYTVADIEATSAALRARGLRLLYDEPRRGTAG